MSESLKFRKIHIDSRLRSSGTNSDFDYSLAETFDTPEGCVCWVDAVVLPHSWRSIDDTNKFLYVAERSGSSGSYTYSVRRVEIATGSHSGPSLKAPIQTALNSNTPAGIGPSYLVTHMASTNQILIATPAASTMHILTDDEIRAYDNALYVINKDDIRSANSVLRNTEGGIGNTSAADYTYTTLYTSGFIDILRHHSVYIASSISSFNTLGPLGQSDIVAKVPVNSSYGSTIHFSANSAGQDFNEVGKRSISSISFRIVDAYSRPVDLEGASWSLSIVFAIKD
jgi:hypothetical protein